MTSFVIVMQSGMLEFMGTLCALSIIEQAEMDYEIVLAITDQYGPLHPTVLEIIKNNPRIRCETIYNDFSPEYKIGNKGFAVNLHFDTDKIIFLDSDILCMKHVDETTFQNYPFSGIPIPPYRKIHGHDKEHWDALYAYFGLTKPEPFCFYQSGFLSIDPNLPFRERWLHNMKKVHEASHARKIPILPESPKSREYCQLSLRVTITELGEQFVPMMPFENNHLINLPEYGIKPTFLVIQRKMRDYVLRGEKLEYMQNAITVINNILTQYPALRTIPAWKKYQKRWLGIVSPKIL